MAMCHDTVDCQNTPRRQQGKSDQVCSQILLGTGMDSDLQVAMRGYAVSTVLDLFCPDKVVPVIIYE